ncbi:hypothetical protein EG329_012535 [Mollisiaceae sp. DMI_Dod_QoI]|nr:hypothetical protein EG329_012535 [Helotiales sp. DMI_Dod_QoI]
MMLYLAFLLASIVGASTYSSTTPSYAPTTIPCPANVQWIRPAIGLTPKETEYVYGRKQKVLYALEEYLERLQLESFDTRQYIQLLRESNFSKVPTIGYAISGGGWASALTGAGAMRALDARFEPAVQARTGGLLQLLTYMSGLSGGSWPIIIDDLPPNLIVSFATSNWPTTAEITAQWHANISRLDGVTNTTQYAATSTDIFEQITMKLKAGFNVSTANYLGRAFAYEFIPGPVGGIATTFSGVTNLSSFLDHEMPFPILQYNEIDTFDPYDITPYEFSAWSGSIGAFTPIEFLGTRLSGGVPVNKSACIRGFDNTGFLIGTSADAFDAWYIQALSNGTEAQFAKRTLRLDGSNGRNHKLRKRAPQNGGFGNLIEEIPEGFEEALGLNLTSSSYGIWPNSFANLTTTSSLVNHSADLRLVDGSESGQAIPLWGQIQVARGLEFIIAWDDNSDAAPYSWNNGTNLYDTYLAANASRIPFPVIPPAATFVNNNYTHKPVFFGCDPLLTTTGDANGPIILYYVNSPYSAYTNYSYGQSKTSASQMYDIYLNGFNLVTQGNGTLAPDWPACIGCAAIDRSVARVGMQRTTQCDSCFQKYCWNGTYDNTDPGIVDLSLYLDPSLGFLEWNKTHDF